MIEVVKGTGVYWGTAHQQLVNNAATPTKLTSAMVDVFFDKKTLSESNAKGGGGGKYTPLEPTIIQAITGM